MLKNFSPPLQIVFDIETTPCLKTAKRLFPEVAEIEEAHLRYVDEDEGLPDGALAMIDLEMFTELNRLCGATEENPEPFLKFCLHRVVSIVGVARKQVAVSEATPTGVELSMFTLPAQDLTTPEATIIRRFMSGVAERKPQLIGWNSVGFDLPVLHQRAIINKLSFPKLQRPAKPWEGADYFTKGSDMNLDLMDLVSSHLGKSKPTLSEFALACGIPGKLGVSGDQVAKLWFAGEHQKIINYNECDTATTYLLWLEMLKFSGHISEEDYSLEQSMFETLLQEKAINGAEHFTEFISTWNRLRGLA